MDKAFEAYVPFKIAQMLNNKGFDDMFYECTRWYNIDNEELFPSPVGRYKGCLPAPTLQMAMKWLREMHGLFIGIDYANIAGLGFTYQATILPNGGDYSYCLHKKSYEEACEAAIKYCFENLI